MKTDPIRGRTFLFTFEDGPMAGATYEHVFAKNGNVKFKAVGAEATPKKASKTAKKPPKKPEAIKYQVANVNADVYAVSYLSPSSGYTLTSILDFKKRTIVAFASNEKDLVAQRGTFEEAQGGRVEDFGRRCLPPCVLCVLCALCG